jgi:hypothetical protein
MQKQVAVFGLEHPRTKEIMVRLDKEGVDSAVLEGA